MVDRSTVRRPFSRRRVSIGLWMLSALALCLGFRAGVQAQSFQEDFDSYLPWVAETDDADPGGYWTQVRESNHACFRIEDNASPPPWEIDPGTSDRMLVLRSSDVQIRHEPSMEVPLGIVPAGERAVLTADVGYRGPGDTIRFRMDLSTGDSFWSFLLHGGLYFESSPDGFRAAVRPGESGDFLAVFPMAPDRWYRVFVWLQPNSDTPVTAGAGEPSTGVTTHCIVDERTDLSWLEVGGEYPLRLHPDADRLDLWYPIDRIDQHTVCVPVDLAVDLTTVTRPGDLYLLARHDFPWPFDTVGIFFGETAPLFAALRIWGPPGEASAFLDNLASNADPGRYHLPFEDGVNLVVNPGFEVEREGLPLGWEIPDGISRDTSRAHSGHASLLVDLDGNTTTLVATTATYMPINHFYDFELEAWVYQDTAGSCRPVLAVEYFLVQFLDYGDTSGTLQSLGVYDVPTGEPGSGRWVHLHGRPGEGSTAPLLVPQFARPIVGLQCPTGASARIGFDDLLFDGLGVDPVRLAVPEVGFHELGVKEVTTALREPVTSGEWLLVDDAGAPIGRGPLEIREEPDVWGRYHVRANLTHVDALRQSGWYRVQLDTDRGTIADWPFEVHERLYERLARLERYYFGGSRCGVATDFHPACHDQDRNEEGALQRYWSYPDDPDGPVQGSLEGGWHDAGDYGKYIHLYGPAIATFAALAEYLVADEVVLPDPDDPIPADGEPWLLALDESRWGAEYFLRVTPESPADCSLREQFWGEVLETGRWVSPAAPDTARLVLGWNAGLTGWVGDPRAMPLHAYGLARLAWLLDQLGGWQELAEQARAEALNQYDCFQVLDGNTGHWCTVDQNLLGVVPRQMLAAIYLFAGLPDVHLDRTRLRNDIDACWDLIDDRLDRGWRQADLGCFEYGFFDPDYQMDFWYGIDSIGKVLPLELVDALGAFLDRILEPEGDVETAREVLEHLERIGDALYGNSDLSIWGHLTEVAPDEAWPEHRQFTHVDRPGHYTTTYDIAVSAALAQIARRLHRPELLVAAERNLQWILGRNPMALNYIGGLPGNMGASFTFLSSLSAEPDGTFEPTIPDQVAGFDLVGPFLANGVLPGGIVKGIMPGEGVAISTPRRAAPVDFPVAYGVTDYPTSGAIGPSEIWLFFVLQLVRAGLEVEHALDELGPVAGLVETNGFRLPDEPQTEADPGEDRPSDALEDELPPDTLPDGSDQAPTDTDDGSTPLDATGDAPPAEGGSDATADGVPGRPGEEEGCSCSEFAARPSLLALLLMVGLLLARALFSRRGAGSH